MQGIDEIRVDLRALRQIEVGTRGRNLLLEPFDSGAAADRKTAHPVSQGHDPVPFLATGAAFRRAPTHSRGIDRSLFPV